MSVNCPDLGDLKIVETYEFYDEPVLFAARNSRGQIYLGLLAEDDSEKRAWLYAPLSPQRYFEVRVGNRELRDAFVSVEDGYLARYTILKHSQQGALEWISASDLNDEDLPSAGEKVRFAADRDILRIAFGFSDLGGSRAPLGALGKILGSLQDTVNAIGQSKMGQATARGSVPTSILDKVQLVVTETYAASFGVELQPEQLPDLFGKTEASAVIVEFFELLRDTESPDKLVERANRLQLRTAQRFRELLSHLSNRVDYVDVQLVSPDSAEPLRVRLQKSCISTALATLRETTEEPEPVDFAIEARLVGCNLRTNSFELFDVHEDQAYVGKIEQGALDATPNPKVGKIYRAWIRQSEKVNATGYVEVQNRLVALEIPKEGVKTQT